MAKPNWEYIRVDVLLRHHPKLDGLSSASKWTLIELWSHCGQMLTDGFVRDAAWKTIGSASTRRQLVDAGLAEPVPGGYRMHDYLEHQRSRAEVEDMIARKSAAGKRSAAARAQARALAEQGVQHGVEQDAEQSVEQDAQQGEQQRRGEERRGEVVLAEVSNRSNGSSPSPPDSINDLIIREIRAVTGKTVSPEWAAVVAGEILGGIQPDNPAAYLRQSIRSEPNPVRRFLPTSQPPRFENLCPVHMLARPCAVCES